MRIHFTIEPSWTIDHYEDDIEIDESELEGLTESERDKHIEETVTDAVNNVCSWGWEIVE